MLVLEILCKSRWYFGNQCSTAPVSAFQINFVELHLLSIYSYNFYFQLEKEAIVKGSALGQALDLDIPPPRPKRKPSNPYPRKTNAGTPTSHSGAKYGNPLIAVASSHGKQAMDFETESLPEVNIVILYFTGHTNFLCFFFQ